MQGKQLIKLWGFVLIAFGFVLTSWGVVQSSDFDDISFDEFFYNKTEASFLDSAYVSYPPNTLLVGLTLIQGAAAQGAGIHYYFLRSLQLLQKCTWISSMFCRMHVNDFVYPFRLAYFT